MRLLDDIAARLRRSDMIQALAIGLLALAFVVAVRWPSSAAEVNEVWFVMAPVRAALLAVAGLIFGALWGSGAGAQPRPDGTPPPPPLEPAEGRATLAALLVVTALTWPFEIASQAASYPDASFARSALVPFLAVASCFALGAWLGAAAKRAGLMFLAPLAVIAVVALALWLEYTSGVNLLNPARGVLEGGTAFLAVNVALGLSLVPLLLRRESRAA